MLDAVMLAYLSADTEANISPDAILFDTIEYGQTTFYNNATGNNVFFLPATHTLSFVKRDSLTSHTICSLTSESVSRCKPFLGRDLGSFL